MTFADGNGENSRIFFGVEITTKMPSGATNAVAVNQQVGVESQGFATMGATQQLTNDQKLFNQREQAGSLAHRQGLQTSY